MSHFTPTRSTTAGFYTNHLTALLSYLDNDHDLAETFAYYIQNHWNANGNSTITYTEPTTYLIPKDREEAIEVSTWLLNTLPEMTTKDAREAVTLARVWAKNFKEPKAVVLGIVGVAVIGPTFGLIKKKKEKNSVMRVVMAESHFNSLDKKGLTAFIAKHTGAQLARELKSAGGNAMQLHPETFDWTFSDHEVELYTHTMTGLQSIIKELKNENLSHTLIKEDNKVVGVVISPMVNDDFIAHSGAKAV